MSICKRDVVNEKGIDQDGVVWVEINEKYYRPCEVDLLLGDASKAEKELGWERELRWISWLRICLI